MELSKGSFPSSPSSSLPAAQAATKSEKKELTAQQKAFAESYFNLGFKSPLKAALAAGYKASGAKKAGDALLEDRRVREYIESLRKQEKENTVISRSEALKLLAAIARGETQEEVWINEYDPQTRKMQTVKRTKSASAKDRINALEIMLHFTEFSVDDAPMLTSVVGTDDKLLKALSKRKIEINVSGEVSFEEDGKDAADAKN